MEIDQVTSGTGLRSVESVDGDAYVERLVLAIQQAIADVTNVPDRPPEIAGANAPYITDALLCVLASIVEQDPACSTPMAMRKSSEEYGRSLLKLVKAARQAREAHEVSMRTSH